MSFEICDGHAEGQLSWLKSSQLKNIQIPEAVPEFPMTLGDVWIIFALIKCCIVFGIFRKPISLTFTLQWQEEYKSKEEVGRMKNCGHEYHVGCIRKWLSMKNSCPICKAPALADSLKQEWLASSLFFMRFHDSVVNVYMWNLLQS